MGEVMLSSELQDIVERTKLRCKTFIEKPEEIGTTQEIIGQDAYDISVKVCCGENGSVVFSITRDGFNGGVTCGCNVERLEGALAYKIKNIADGKSLLSSQSVPNKNGLKDKHKVLENAQDL
jgi:hypothetical protein